MRDSSVTPHSRGILGPPSAGLLPSDEVTDVVDPKAPLDFAGEDALVVSALKRKPCISVSEWGSNKKGERQGGFFGQTCNDPLLRYFVVLTQAIHSCGITYPHFEYDTCRTAAMRAERSYRCVPNLYPSEHEHNFMNESTRQSRAWCWHITSNVLWRSDPRKDRIGIGGRESRTEHRLVRTL